MGVNVIQLTSKNYHENILASLQRLRTEGHLTDVTVQVDNQGYKQEFQAHKLMLAASSGYFKTALFSQDAAQEKILLPTVQVEHFSKFLEFVYTGKIELLREKIGDVLAVAECLDCKDLAEVCREALTAGIVQDPAAAIYEPAVVDTHELHGKTSQGAKRKRQPRNSQKQPVQSPEIEVKAKRGKAKTPASGESQGKKRKVGSGGRKVVQRRTTRQRQTFYNDGQGSNEDSADAEDGAEAEDQQESMKPQGDASMIRIPSFDEDWEGGAHNEDSDEALQPSARNEEEDKDQEESKESRKKPSKAQFQCNKCQRTFHYERSYLKHIRYISHVVSGVQGVILKSNVWYYACMQRCSTTTLHGCMGTSHAQQTPCFCALVAQILCCFCKRNLPARPSVLQSTYHGVKADVVYRCETCEQTFANRSNLKIHEKHVHSSERLYPCDSCTKTFKRKKDVVRHQRQVRGAAGG